MNATKTTLCMLLSAAIGSAATATALWEMQRKEEGRAPPGRQEVRYLIEKIEEERIENPIPPRHGLPYGFPAGYGKIDKYDTLMNRSHELHDAMVKCASDAEHLILNVEGVEIAFTTSFAQDRYFKAIDNMIADGPAGSEKRQYLVDSIKQAQPYKTLSNGIPAIDYSGATRLARIAYDHHNRKHGQTGE